MEQNVNMLVICAIITVAVINSALLMVVMPVQILWELKHPGQNVTLAAIEHGLEICVIRLVVAINSGMPMDIATVVMRMLLLYLIMLSV